MVFLTCALCIGAISLPPPPQSQRTAVPQNGNQQQQNPIRQNPVATLPPGPQAELDRIARALEATNASRNSPGEIRRAEENLQVQKDIAYWSRWAAYIAGAEVLVTAIGVILVGFTLRAALRAAAAAEHSQ